METPRVRNPVSTDDGSPVEAPHRMREMMVAFFKAMNNIGIYPADHIICRNAVAGFKAGLDEVLLHHDPFRLDVERDRLLHEGRVIYQSSGKEGDLPVILFRDGIRWIAFEAGIESSEILRFLDILHRYKHLKREAEGDIVTALWEAGLTHVRYDAADVLWDAEPLVDFGRLDIEPPSIEQRSGSTGADGFPDPAYPTGAIDEEATAPARPGEDESDSDRKTCGVADLLETQGEILSIASPEIDRGLWKLTEAETIELQRMVIEEETWSGIDDILDVLLAILQEQQTEEDYSTILEFMVEEFRATLEQFEFKIAADFLENMTRMERAYTEEGHPAAPHLRRFFHAASGPEVLDVLGSRHPEMAALSDDRLNPLRRLLLQLHPRAVDFIGLMLLDITDARIRKIFMEVIGSLAGADPFCLEALLKRPEEKLVQQIVFILGHLKHPDAVPLLIRMLTHPSEPIRKMAMKAILSRGNGALLKVFPLIEDPSPEIRRMILNLMSRRRSRQAETLLLEYLTEARYGIREPLHVIECYRALGRCGSFHSLPFLRAVLLEKGWKGIFGMEKPHERQGAAMALMELKLEAADAVLQKAAGNRFTAIRSACRKAFEAMR